MRVYPTTDLALLTRLAEALGTDVEMLVAIADGRVPADRIIGMHPAGGAAVLGTLADWNDLLRDVADRSPNGYAARERRDRQQRAEEHRRRQGRASPQRPCIMYRLLDKTGRVLYVGVTRNPEARIKAHQRRWGDVIASVTTEEFTDAASMLAAEAKAIREENPPLNVQGVEGDDAST